MAEGIPGLDYFSSISFGKAFYYFEIVLAIVALAALVYWIGNRSRYNTKVKINEMRGKDFIVKWDMGRTIVDKDGATKFRLLKARETLDIPDAKYFKTMSGGFLFKRYIEFNQYSPHGYALPDIDMSPDGMTMRVPNIEKNMSNMLHLARQLRSMLDNKNFWEKWLPILIPLFLFGILVVAIMFTWNGITKVTANLATVSEQLATAVKVFSECRVGGAGVP